MKIIVVTGSRDATPDQLTRLRVALDKAKPDLVLVGDCPDRWNETERRLMRSIDQAALDWCAGAGVECMVAIAQWRKHGRAAGPRRNNVLAVVACELFANRHQVSFLAYPGDGSGTRDCVRRLQGFGIPEGES